MIAVEPGARARRYELLLVDAILVADEYGVIEEARRPTDPPQFPSAVCDLVIAVGGGSFP